MNLSTQQPCTCCIATCKRIFERILFHDNFHSGKIRVNALIKQNYKTCRFLSEIFRHFKGCKNLELEPLSELLDQIQSYHDIVRTSQQFQNTHQRACLQQPDSLTVLRSTPKHFQLVPLVSIPHSSCWSFWRCDTSYWTCRPPTFKKTCAEKENEAAMHLL